MLRLQMLAFCRRRVLLGFALASLALVAGCEKRAAACADRLDHRADGYDKRAISANGSTPIVAQVLEASGFPPH